MRLLLSVSHKILYTLIHKLIRLVPEIGIQILIVFVGGQAFQVASIGGREWGISLALGVVSIPLGALIRLMPNGPFETLFNRLGLLGKTDVLPTANHESEVWSGAVAMVRDNLFTFSNIRGGRLRSSSFVIKSRLMRKSQENQAPPLRVYVSLDHLFDCSLI